MAAIGGLAPESEAQRPSFAPPEDGWHNLQVTESDGPLEVKKEPGTGEQYYFEIEVVDGPDKSKSFRHYCTTKSATPRKQSGGLFNLNQICKAVGMKGYSEMNDTEETHFKVFRGALKSEERKDKPGYYNTNIVMWGFEEDGEPDVKGARQNDGSARTTGNGGAAASGAGASDWRSQARG